MVIKGLSKGRSIKSKPSRIIVSPVGDSMCLFVGIEKVGGDLGKVNSTCVALWQERPCRVEELKENQYGWSIVKRREWLTTLVLNTFSLKINKIPMKRNFSRG